MKVKTIPTEILLIIFGLIVVIRGPVQAQNQSFLHSTNQDMGRVLLNVITNAFHTVTIRSKANTDPVSKQEVAVSIKQAGKKIGIHLKDNGEGIPEQVREKIFEPFFTTTPPGRGTGLGLSLSYDIIKAHEGEIILKSEAGKGTDFIITLPIK